MLRGWSRFALACLVATAACVQPASFECDDGLLCPFDHRCPAPLEVGCQPQICGDGVIDTGEVCDDGNLDFGDGCAEDCRSNEICGNGVIDFFKENCDDGNTHNHDGCSRNCNLEPATWTRQIQGQLPPSRNLHALAYDAARARTVLFGGIDESGVVAVTFDDTWEFDGVTWFEFITSPTQTPSPRFGHALAYDVARARTVLFGGYDGTYFGDTWEFDGVSWSQVITPPAATPSPRNNHALAYDSARARTVLFGGHRSSDVGVTFDDTWEFDGVTWFQVITSPAQTPSPRYAHALAYDVARARTVLFGGVTDGPSHNDTWELDGVTWSQVALAGQTPPELTPRYGHSLSYDAYRARTVLFGGFDGVDGVDSIFRDDTWEFDGTSWSPVSTPLAETPPPREYHAAAYDAARTRIMLFGGLEGVPLPAKDRPFNDTWQFDGTSWLRVIPPAADDPPVSDGYAFAYDAGRARTVLFTGTNALLSETWEFDGSAWEVATLPGSTPPSRINHALAYDAARARTVLFGGLFNTTTLLDDTWEFDGSTWMSVTVPQSPSPRFRHALAYDAARARVVLFGGDSNNDAPVSPLGDTWEFDGASWSQVIPLPANQTPSSRCGHALVYDAARARIVLFGGDIGIETGTLSGIVGDTWELDGAFWSQVASPPAPAPSPRYGHALAYDAARARVVLFGGTGVVIFRDTWEFDGATWSQIIADQTPRLATGVAIAYDAVRDHIVLLGSPLKDPITETWTFRYSTDATDEACGSGRDLDGDDLVGCADPDCWNVCTPTCPPAPAEAGVTAPTAPFCGDGECQSWESYRLCPGDCTPPALMYCGDFFCDPPEDAATCPSDCGS